MSPIDKKAELNEIFDLMEGKNHEKVKRIAEILGVKVNTVRIWMSKAKQPIPTHKLELLKMLVK